MGTVKKKSENCLSIRYLGHVLAWVLIIYMHYQLIYMYYQLDVIVYCVIKG